jgi:hypothetical protein
MIVRNGFLSEREVSALHAIWDSRRKQEASKAFDLFVQTLEGKYVSAVECLRHRRTRHNGSAGASIVA